MAEEETIEARLARLQAILDNPDSPKAESDAAATELAAERGEGAALTAEDLSAPLAQAAAEDGKEAKGGSVQPHVTWTPPIGIDVDRLGFDSFLLADSDDERSHSNGIGSGVAEEKGTFACQL